MWCVMQVPTGREQELQKKCEEKLDSSVLEKSFLPYYDEMRKVGGGWTIVRKILFPGYVFMITERPKELLQELRKINGWKTLLKAGEDILYISKAEEEFLKEFGSEDQVVHVSRGIIEGKRIIITEGPLKGHEANIRRIDRHKRLAFLELHLFSEVIHTRVALEIYEKRAEAAFPDVEALYVHRRQEQMEVQPTPELVERESYEVRLMQTPGAVVSLEADQSPEQIEEIHRETKEALQENKEQKGE